MVSYVSAETSTSGILVEDVLHLTEEDNHHGLVEANVIFGLVSLLNFFNLQCYAFLTCSLSILALFYSIRYACVAAVDKFRVDPS